MGKRFAHELDDPQANEQNGCQHALQEKTYTWPAVEQRMVITVAGLILRRPFFISDFPFVSSVRKYCQATSKIFPIPPFSAAA